MRRRTSLQVQTQGAAYPAVVGVTVGMLIAGVAVPFAFGRTASDTESLVNRPGYGQPTSPSDSGGPLPIATLPPSQAGTTGAIVGAATTGGTAGSGTTGAASGGATGATSGGAVGRLTSSDQGVTPTTVKLGVVLLDIRALEPLGFGQPHFSPEEQREQYQVFIDEVNKSGGLHGRKIVPDYKIYNALDSDGDQSGPAICVQLAEDDKVFAAVGVLGGGMDACLTQQYGIPAISNTSQIDEVYRKSRNLLASLYPTLEREAANWGDLAARNGLLNGHKTATLYGDGPQEARPEQALVGALKAAGQPVTYRAKLGGDPATVQSQLPVEVRGMQTAGVDTVFLVTNFVTAIQFVQTAERQGFRPQYHISDIGSLQAEGLVGSMPASFDRAIGFTAGASSKPEHPGDRKCRETFNKATGKRYAAGNEAAGTTLFCWMVKAFAAGAKLTGTDLTRKGMALSFQRLTLNLGKTLPGSFGPGKTDYADYLRMIRYDRSCRCYRDAGPGQRGRY